MAEHGLFWENPETGQYDTSARNLLIAMRYFREHPDGCIPTGMWTHSRWTHAEFRKWFLERLSAKINRNDPRSGWRKFQPQYQSLLTVDAHYLKQYWERRVRFYSLMSPELIERFSHLIARHDD